MRLLKASFFGLVGGALYGFCSFYLLVPYYKNLPLTLVGLAVQGLLLGFFFQLIKMIFVKISMKLQNVYLQNFLAGGVGGLLSASLNVLITLNATYHNPNVGKEVFFILLKYCAGSALAGLVVGFCIAKSEVKAEVRG